MIAEIVTALIGGLGVGLVLGRPRDKRMRCGAQEEYRIMDGKDVIDYTYRRCREPADPRCQANHCTKHCRAQDRCDGSCLKEIA